MIPATFSEDHTARLRRRCADAAARQPEEIAPSYVFLTSDDASYMTGQILHPNGGEVING